MINSIKHFEEKSIPIFEQLEVEFWKDPTRIAELVLGIREELQKLGLRIIQECLEDTNQMIRESVVRKNHWVVEHKADTKELITSLGTVTFSKTLFKNKETKETTYLLDRLMGLEEKERITEDAEAKMLEEAVETSYRRGGENASQGDNVTKQTVMNKIHALNFPVNTEKPVKKKVVDYLYIEADEDHIALQFHDKKGDLKVNEKGRKDNGLISKLVYVHEGLRPESIIAKGTDKERNSKRYELINPYYFARVCSGKENEIFWEEIFQWLDNHYDLLKIKKIYLNADGGAWIQAGIKRIDNVTYALDEFHLQKYILKLTGHMKDSTEDARKEIYRAIRNNDPQEFESVCERLKDALPSEQGRKRVETSRDYILNNWMAARVRIKRETGVVGSSTEGHVYHALSVRMSTRPMGWSVVGASKMSELRAYYLNGGDMLELVRYQEKELPKVAGMENQIITAGAILSSENKRNGGIGKYLEKMHHDISTEISKKHWYKAVLGEMLW